MTSFPRTSRLMVVASTLAATALVSAAPQRTTPRFYDDDPVSRIADTQDASKVEERKRSLEYDALVNLLGRPGEQIVGRAGDVNTIDEVPDSSWYTNRVPPLTAERVFLGVNDDSGPVAGPWTVTRKSNGVSAGFTISDSRGTVYHLKFDPPKYPELGTATEAVVTRLLYALGYNVPQSNIVTVRPQDLAVGKEDATVTVAGGRKRPMHQSDIEAELRDAYRNPDGTYRAVAGSHLQGTTLEGFMYTGTRPDDPNDVIPHEDRRELRGLRVFAAWLNHTDVKPINSMDVLEAEGPRKIVRHYLIDFNAALGSAGTDIRERRDGWEYLAEPRRAVANIPTLGLHPRRWMRIRYPEYRGAGRLEVDEFVPEEWRPRIPNAAFIRSRPDDTFWAARKLAALSDDVIRAAVKAGRYSDPKAEEFVAKALIARRDKCVRAWLSGINPIVDPELGVTGWLTFHNAAVELAGVERPSGYKALWHEFNNETGEVSRIAETAAANERLRVPDGLPSAPGSFVRVDVAASGGPNPSWGKPVNLYFKRTAQGWRLVGLERMPGAPPMRPGLVGAEPAKHAPNSLDRRAKHQM